MKSIECTYQAEKETQKKTTHGKPADLNIHQAHLELPRRKSLPPCISPEDIVQSVLKEFDFTAATPPTKKDMRIPEIRIIPATPPPGGMIIPEILITPPAPPPPEEDMNTLDIVTPPHPEEEMRKGEFSDSEKEVQLEIGDQAFIHS